MRRRESIYYVLRGAQFSREDWRKLAAALPSFAKGWLHTAEYVHNRESVHPTQEFCVWRADHKYLTKDEINVLYWFFLGVRAAHNIKPVEPGPGGRPR
jgi:hypothetical protein